MPESLHSPCMGKGDKRSPAGRAPCGWLLPATGERPWGKALRQAPAARAFLTPPQAARVAPPLHSHPAPPSKHPSTAPGVAALQTPPSSPGTGGQPPGRCGAASLRAEEQRQFPEPPTFNNHFCCYLNTS